MLGNYSVFSNRHTQYAFIALPSPTASCFSFVFAFTKIFSDAVSRMHEIELIIFSRQGSNLGFSVSTTQSRFPKVQPADFMSAQIFLEALRNQRFSILDFRLESTSLCLPCRKLPKESR